MLTETENREKESISVVCFLWNDGLRNYLPDHVNQLAEMIDRHLSYPHRFICITDEEEGFSDKVEPFKLPDSARWTLGLLNPTKERLPSSYRRLWLFSEDAKILGDRILMLDIDCLIVNSLDPIFDFEADFVGWRPRSEETTKVKAKVPYQRIGGGTWLLRTGSKTYIWDTFSKEGIEAAKKEGWRGSDQAWLSYNLAKDCEVFPNEIGIYHTQDGAKHWEETPEDAKIIHFNGKVNPWDEDAQSRPWFCRLIGVPYDAAKWKRRGIKPDKPRDIRQKIDIVLYWWGNWPDGDAALGRKYIKKMVAGINRHMPKNINYRIVLFTDDVNVRVSGVDIRGLKVPHDLKWNLKKMFMYSDMADLERYVLCIDLDCVIIGDLYPIVGQVLSLRRKLLITCAAVYRRRRRRLGGSVVGFKSGHKLTKLLWEPLLGERREFYENATGGSERRYLQRMLGPPHVALWDRYLPGQILSYKRDCEDGLPANTEASIVRFHGHPRPHQVNDAWVQENWA